VHPFPSVTVKIYVPGAKLLIDPFEEVYPAGIETQEYV
jgi:hypothetical protein